MEKIVIEHDEMTNADCLIATSTWSPSYEAVMRDKKIWALRLSFSRGWKDSDLDFVRNLDFLRSIEIYNWDVSDLTPLYSLPNLNFMSIQADVKKVFSLKNFPYLKTFMMINFSSKIKDLSSCSELEHINIVNYPGESFTSISNLVKLTRVQITSYKLISTEGIEKLINLKDLDLAGCRKLHDLKGLNQAKCLRTIRLTSCRKISDIDVIGELDKLESLMIEDCGTINSIGFLENCKNLKTLHVVGKTSVSDGDFSVVDKLPKLENVLIVGMKSKTNSTLSEKFQRLKIVKIE